MAGGYRVEKEGLDAVIERIKKIESRQDAQAAAAGILSAIITNPNGSRMTFDNGQIKIWPNFDTEPDVFTLISADSDVDRMVRWFAPTDGGDVLANSFSMQGASDTEHGNMWLYTDGQLLFSAGERVYLSGGAGIDIVTNGDLKVFNLPTTGSAANLRIDPGTAQIQYETSSRRYKQDIEDLDIDPEAFLQLRPRTWRDKGEVEREPETTRRNVGFIAEEVDELGLPFVDYDAEGRPDALQYNRFMAGAVKVMQSQAAQINDLTARLEALENLGA